ncbi:MAG: DUF4411 family protein [Limisphaerales bacterium]
MAYLLDSNTLIQAKNDFYPFDMAKPYWDWLIKANQDGHVYSVEKVMEELQGHADQLSVWSKSLGLGFFLPPDEKTAESLKAIAVWLDSHNTYSSAAKAEFLNDADYWLIAHAHAHRHAVVTFEKHENSKHRVKIPSVCNHFGVPCVKLFEMLRKQGFGFGAVSN